MKLRALIIFLALLILSLVSLIFLIKPKVTKSEAQVAATIFPIYDITRNIAPDEVEVALIVPPGSSPHTFEPKPSTVAELESAKVIFAIGHGLDGWVQNIAQGVNAPVVLVDQNVQLRPSAEVDSADSDPHYWLSIVNAKIIAANIASDLKTRFPNHQTEIDSKLDNYLSQLDAANAQIENQLSTLNNRQIITLHDAWYYFADEYGLTVVGSFEPTAGREPTPQYLVELTQAIEKAKAKTLYSEPQLSVSSIQSFITDNNLNLAILDPIGGTPSRDTFIKLMLYNAQTIAQNQK